MATSARRLSIPGASALLVTLAAAPLVAQEETTGYRIDDETVLSRCVRCHAVDEAGRMSRISYLRKTPEGWQTSIRRMVALHGARLNAEDARAIVRYLSDEQGLAPEELRPGLFEVERRLIDHDYEGDSGVEYTCIQCHSMGRVITQRRTEEEWGLLLSTHRGLYPLVDFQAFISGGDGPQPMDEAQSHLSEVFPLETAEWSAWAATKRAPRLAGTWVLSGYEPGKGPFYGGVTVDADRSDPASVRTTTRYVYAESGQEVQRTGSALVYTGYQWRGRSNPDSDSELREVMFVERNQQEMSGRWYTGYYDEIGMDVSLSRVPAGPVVSGVYPRAVQSGQTTAVTVYGANLPQAGEANFDFGPGIRVLSTAGLGGDVARVTLSVAEGARSGSRDLFAGGATLAGAIVVHDGIDRIEVTPETGMARVGGVVYPKGTQTFDAIAWDDGRDGEANTEDDLKLGRVPVTWSVEEYAAVFGDDDIDFIGELRQDGTFIPAVDGPNPARSGNRNNIGDVYVVATHRTADGTELSARSHLVVTVPNYMRFEPWREIDAPRVVPGVGR